MISKLRFSLIAVIMLVLLGFGFQDQAKGQVGLDGLFCPAVPNTTGYLETEIVGSGLVFPDFRGGLIGTVEAIPNGVDLVAGLDWQHVDQLGFFGTDTPTPTNETGSQLVSWWTQKDGRNTYLQVTNASGIPVTVHVRIHNEDCLEIRDFCDTYTPYDTHEYNFGDLVSNGGQNISDGNLQGVEGWLVVTAVDEECDTDGEQAIDHNFLAGQLIVHDSNDYLYGVNTYARQAVCFDDEPIETDINLVQNGSFQTGVDSNWTNGRQGHAAVVTADQFSPVIPVPLNPDPDTDNPSGGNPNLFQAVVVSSADTPSGAYDGGTFNNLPTDLVTPAGAETNVSIFQSDDFFVQAGDESTVKYDLSLLTGNTNFLCRNFAAVLLIQDNGGNQGTIIDATCYVEAGTLAGGAIISQVSPGGGKPCVELADSDDDIAYSLYEFNGRSGYQLDRTLSRNGNTGNFVLQVVTGQESDSALCNFLADDNGAVVDNFRLIHTQLEPVICDGTLDGSFNAFLDFIEPDTLFGQFNVLPGNVSAGADVVLINFADSYGFLGLGPYRPIPAFSLVSVSIFDDLENAESCGDALVCFTRLGIDDAIVPSEDVVPPTLTPTSPPPTITPTSPPPTLAPTPTPSPTNNGGSSSCAIAASPVQLGTALANVLIPLVPVAFAFGVRAVRRRKK